ncbi:ABC transporter permease, partial [Vibrio cholerae]|nr:ABC transporter permease [Vibrio cholerae]
MDFLVILQAGVASGTVLLFATLGEVFAERSGVLNLGVEGMMLIGAMTG